jgi:hypothetical protein
MQKQAVPLDFNNLGGAIKNNPNLNNYNNSNILNGYPRGSYMNENQNNYNPNFSNQTQNINNNFKQSTFNINNQQNFSNTLNNNYEQDININNNKYAQFQNQNYKLNNQKEIDNDRLSFHSPSPNRIVHALILQYAARVPALLPVLNSFLS